VWSTFEPGAHKKRERKPLNLRGLCALCGKLSSNLPNHALFWHQNKDLGFTIHPRLSARYCQQSNPGDNKVGRLLSVCENIPKLVFFIKNRKINISRSILGIGEIRG